MSDKPKKDKVRILNILYFIISLIMAVLWLYFIYGMSAKSGEESAGISYKIAKSVYRFPVFLHIFQFDTFHLLIRKAAHFTEYGILALMIMNFLNSCRRMGIKNGDVINKNFSVINRYFIIGTLIFCCVYASLDEYHQSFVDGRGPGVRDVCIDTVGACVFLFMFAWGNRRRAQHSTKKKGETCEKN